MGSVSHQGRGAGWWGSPVARLCACWACPRQTYRLRHAALLPEPGPEALTVLDNVLMNGVFHMSSVMPAALPFLIRLAAVPGTAVRRDLIDILIVAAELSSPADTESQVLLVGEERDHPERGACRAAFRTHAAALRALLEDETLPDGLIGADDRECLLKAAESWPPHGRGAAAGSR
ncbi:hypothetical protein [Streptomyces sp. NPDC056290]|uniref:hypothetical protein n=1 Tax=Streptomyces sp. NPDC056290 TaxID=3345771 RepID=UPI0035DBBCB5